MNVWRVSDYTDLSGRGGLVSVARWHSLGTPVVYCADHPATALLEKLVHIDIQDMPEGYTLLTVEIPDTSSYTIEIAALPPDWMSNITSTQTIGTEILERTEHLLIWVPSVLVPFAWNALINPRHADAPRCTVTDITRNLFEPRLIR